MTNCEPASGLQQRAKGNGKKDYAHDDTRCDALIILFCLQGFERKFAACLSSLCDQAIQISWRPEHRCGPSLKNRDFPD